MADLVSIDAKTTSAHTPARATHTAAAAATTSFAATLTKVSGHAYAKVEDGSAKDSYVNQAAGNARKGELFRLVERDGRSFHVYGSGDDATVVEVKAAGATTATPATTTDITGGQAAPS